MTQIAYTGITPHGLLWCGADYEAACCLKGKACVRSARCDDVNFNTVQRASGLSVFGINVYYISCDG